MTREQMIDTAVRRVAKLYVGSFTDRLVWMATYIPICGDNSPYLIRVREEFASLANG